MCASSHEIVGLGHHQDDLELGLLPHAPSEAFGEATRGQELVFDVDGAGGMIDGVEEQGLDFADLRGFVGRGRGARNADVDFGEIGRRAGRPGVADRAHGRRTFACATHPALARQFSQRACGATVDHRLYVVERVIRYAGRVDPARIVEPMLSRIPAP